MKKYILTICLVWSIVFGIAGIVQAELIRWYLEDATFYDGTNITGYFDYNTSTGGIENRNIITQNGYNYNGTTSIAGDIYDNTNGTSYQEFDTGNSYSFESLLKFFTTSVWVDSTTRIYRSLWVINWDHTGLTIDLSQEGTYIYQPLNGNFGYESITTYHYTGTGEYIDHDSAPRYINNFTLTTGSGAPVPEPTTMLLLGTGVIGLVGARRKSMK